jgi:general secretion pathway protein H
MFSMNPKLETRNSKPVAGFTLIEILVVMVIVGLTLALIGLNLMPDDQRVLRNEAQRLALLLEQARDEAVLSSEAIGWSAAEGHYNFWRRDEEGKWVAWTQDALWRERQFSSGVVLRALRINHNVVPPNERLNFSPAGLGVPFEIDLGFNAARIEIVGDVQGKVTLKEAG